MGLTPDQQKRLAKFKANSVPTVAELKMMGILESLEIRYLYQKGFMAGLRTFFIADFYLPKPHKLVIEVDGEYHKYQEKYDRFKDEYYRSRGFRVYRVSNYDVLNKRGLVEKDLLILLDRGKEKTK